MGSLLLTAFAAILLEFPGHPGLLAGGVGHPGLGLFSSARAQSSASPPPGSVACDIRSILADNRSGGIDARLAGFPQLKRAPFAAFKRLELLASDPIILPPSATNQITLPNGRVLKLTYRERLGGKSKPRLRLQLAIGRAERPTLLSRTNLLMDDGETLFHGGQPYRTGKLIVAITCRTK